MLGLLRITLGTFVMQPLDYDFDYSLVEESATEVIQQPLYEWVASWYDYKLWGEWRSKNHNTCAMRDGVRYQTYKVCLKWTDKCVECYLNDYWPTREDRIIDLSSHAFKELWVSLSRWLAEVEIYNVDK